MQKLQVGPTFAKLSEVFSTVCKFLSETHGDLLLLQNNARYLDEAKGLIHDKTGEPDVSLIEPIELDRWTSIERRDVMSRFLAMPTAAAAMERIDPAPEPEPEPAPAPAAAEQKQLDKVM